MPIVDAHPHIYSSDRDAYPTIKEPWEPGEPAAAEDLKKIMDAVGVDRAVFIQTSTFYGHDNRYIMDSAKEHAAWACGVLTLDPDNDSHIDLLEDGVANSNIRGMRGTTDSLNRIATPNVYRLWTKAMELGIPVNCMVMDDLDRVPEIERIAQDLGDLKIIIDHTFMLNTRHRTEETLVALERLAQLPNVYAKLTAGTHGSYRVYPYVDMHDPLKRVIEAFSPKRCVWGSNFPNALWSKGATYAQNLHLFVKELGLSLPDKADILGVTAMSLWFPNEHEVEERAVKEQHQRTERESIQAQEDEQDASADDEQPVEALGHTAQITMMADLIAAEGVIEGPILDEMDGVEVSAILEAAGELNAVLDTLDFPEKSAEADIESSEDSDESSAGDESASDVTVNVEELLASQNYTPIDTAEIGDAEDVEHDIASDVQAQMDEALGSVAESDKIDFEDIELDDGDGVGFNVEELLAAQHLTESDSEEEASFDVEALLAEQDSASNVEAEGVSIDVEELLAAPEGEPENPEQVAVDEIAADVQAQLTAALGSFEEPPELEIVEIEPEEIVTNEITVDVEMLLAEQGFSPQKTDKANPPESAQAEEDEEFDLSSIIEAADQLNAALESANEDAAIVPVVAAPEASEASAAPESPGDVVVNVEELLASQNYTPIKTDEIGKPGPSAVDEADSGDGEEMNVAGLMDVANQLNSMLESVDNIASNINDLVVESDDEIDQSERPPA